MLKHEAPAVYGNALIQHENATYLLIEFLNGAHSWLFDIMRQLEGGAGGGLKREDARCLLNDFLVRLHAQYRRYNVTAQSHSDFLHANPDTVCIVMTYFLNTLASRFNGNFIFVLSAMDIALNRREGDFEKFRGASPMELRDSLFFYTAFAMSGR
jgi:hypothetical protein